MESDQTLRGLSSLKSRLSATFNDLMQRGSHIYLLDGELAAINHDLSLKGRNRPNWSERRFLRQQGKRVSQEMSKAVSDFQAHHGITPSAFLDRANKLSREIRQVQLFQKQMQHDGLPRSMPDRYTREENAAMNYTPQELANKKRLEEEELKRRKFRKKQSSAPLPSPPLSYNGKHSFNEALVKFKQTTQKMKQDRINRQKQIENRFLKNQLVRPLPSPQKSQYKTIGQKLTPKQAPVNTKAGLQPTQSPLSHANPLLRSGGQKSSTPAKTSSRQPGHNPLLRGTTAPQKNSALSKVQGNPLLRSPGANAPAKGNAPARSNTPSQSRSNASGRSGGSSKSSRSLLIKWALQTLRGALERHRLGSKRKKNGCLPGKPTIDSPTRRLLISQSSTTLAL